MATLGVLGGTGDLGLGLALRYAAAGDEILIGSRAAERAQEAAGKVRAAVPAATVDGLTNPEVIARCERIVLSLPFEGLDPLLTAEGANLAGKLLIDVIVPLEFSKAGCRVGTVPGFASVTEMIQSRVPESRVVSAFKNVPASELQDLQATLQGDVLVCGTKAEARAEVLEMVSRLPGLRGVDAGGLASAHPIEAITALLVNLNRRHKAHSSIQIAGLPG